MSLDINYNPQSVIDEWNDKPEQEQYTMLKYSIIRAAKNFSMAYALELNEPEELIGEAWLNLQNKLNAQHIQKLAERKQFNIGIKFLLFTAASYTLSKVMYNHRRKHKEYGNSLNERIGKEKITELIEIIQDDSQGSLEDNVISNIIVEETLKDLKPKHKTIMLYAMNGYAPREISTITGFKPQAIRNCQAYVRKKLGRKENPPAIDFSRFSKAYERVLGGEIKAVQCRRELDMKEGTFYVYVNKYRMANDLPIAPYLAKQKRFAGAETF